jgi:hypothetical protein
MTLTLEVIVFESSSLDLHLHLQPEPQEENHLSVLNTETQLKFASAVVIGFGLFTAWPPYDAVMHVLLLLLFVVPLWGGKAQILTS